MLRALRARSGRVFCDEISAQASKRVSILSNFLSKPREPRKYSSATTKKNRQNEWMFRHPCSCPDVEAFIARYILDPQNFRHLSRFIFDMAPPENQAFIEKIIATNSDRANARPAPQRTRLKCHPHKAEMSPVTKVVIYLPPKW